MTSLKKQILALGILLSFFSAAQADWVITPGSINTTGRYEDISFINEMTGWAVDAAGVIIKTTNGGINFVVQFDSSGIGFRSVAFHNALTGWAGSPDGYLYRTTDGGTTWLRVDQNINPAPFGFCGMVTFGNNTMYGSGRYSGPTQLVKTTNGGASYQYIDMSAYTTTQIGVFFRNENTGYIAGKSNISSEGAVLLYTTNGGATFTKNYKSEHASEHIWYIKFHANDPNFGFGSVQSFWQTPWSYIKTTNGGTNWTRINLPGTSSIGSYAEAIDFINPNTGWLACGNSTGLYQTTNGGTNWVFQNFGQSIHSIKVVNDSVAYGCGKDIYKYTRTLTSVGSNGENVSKGLSHVLYPNFPNPFNPTTTFKYNLFKKTFVNLSIYDVEGKLVKELFNGQQGQGDYQYNWDASGMPSGIYFYTLITDQGMQRFKGVLLK